MPKKKKPAQSAGPIKLNLGSGDYPIKGYQNLDRKNGHEVYPLDSPDASVDEIRASHVLEHFGHRQTADVVSDWFRALKPGGILKVAVPDFEKICEGYLNKSDPYTLGYTMGGHVDDDDRHGAIFDHGSLSQILMNAGFESVREWIGDYDDCSTLPVSLNLQAQKPAAPAGTLEFKGVVGVYPTARYGPSETHRCVYEALAELKLEVHCAGGCFWHQNWSRSVEKIIANPDCRYVLSFDYDGVFKTNDIAELYRIMETHPHIDALVSMQAGRGKDVLLPLFTIHGADGKRAMAVSSSRFDALTTEIRTGHFGLTLIRADKLRAFPRPWMLGVPDEQGQWGDGRQDPDIYFWNRWHEAGFTAHLACRVVIGHIQEKVLWPDRNLERFSQDMDDYLMNGKPKEAR